MIAHLTMGYLLVGSVPIDIGQLTRSIESAISDNNYGIDLFVDNPLVVRESEMLSYQYLTSDPKYMGRVMERLTVMVAIYLNQERITGDIVLRYVMRREKDNPKEAQIVCAAYKRPVV